MSEIPMPSDLNIKQICVVGGEVGNGNDMVFALTDKGDVIFRFIRFGVDANSPWYSAAKPDEYKYMITSISAHYSNADGGMYIYGIAADGSVLRRSPGPASMGVKWEVVANPGLPIN